MKKEDGEKPDEETEAAEKKFTGRCRLFVGNLPNDTKEDAFKKLFEPFGEFTEVYVNTLRGFGFIRMVSLFWQVFSQQHPDVDLLLGHSCIWWTNIKLTLGQQGSTLTLVLLSQRYCSTGTS